MKQLLSFLLTLLVALALSSCGSSGGSDSSAGGEDINLPPAGNSSAYLHYTLPNQYAYVQGGGLAADEAAALFSSYTLTTGIVYDSTGTLVSGYALPQFIDKDDVNSSTPDPDDALGAYDGRELYAYVVRSNQDGFSNRTKFYDNGTNTEVYNPDLRWDQFNQGYLLDMNYTGKVFFPQTLLPVASGGFAKMYNNKYAYDVYMFRKIDVKRPDAAGSLATFEVSATTDNYVNDTNYNASTGLSTTKFTVETMTIGSTADVKAIPLTQFLTDYVTDAPANYTYKIVGLDGSYKEGWTYADMQKAYYLPDYDYILQVDASNKVISNTQITFPVRIELISASGTVEYNFSAKNPPAYAKAYDE